MPGIICRITGGEAGIGALARKAVRGDAPSVARGALAPRTASLHQVALGLVAPPRRGCTREYSLLKLPAFLVFTPLRKDPVLARGARRSQIAGGTKARVVQEEPCSWIASVIGAA